MESSIYQADKIKKISIVKNQLGEISAGGIVLITPENEYDLPFVVVDITFMSIGKVKIFTELDAKLLVKDEESERKHTRPFQKWREAIGKLPSEPITGRPEIGEFFKDNMSPINYLGFIPEEYTDDLLNLTNQFFDIYINLYRQAELVKDDQRRNKMDTFRSEFNRHFLTEDPSGVMLINAFGLEKAQLFCEHIVYL